MKYDARGNPAKTALAVRNTNSGRWKEVSVSLANEHLGNRCPHGADVMLVNTSKENTLFHMIEVVRP